MKKEIILLILVCTFLYGCQNQKKTNYHKVIINGEELKYLNIDEKLSETVEESIIKIINRHSNLKNTNYRIDSYFNGSYLSYVLTLKTKDDTKLYTFNYEVESRHQICFNKEKIIEILNQTNKKYSFQNSDIGFLTYYINQDFLDIYISKYITGVDIQLTKIPMTKDLIQTENKEEENHKKIALTFDDGPSKRTKEIVDLLEKKQIKATFFVLGSNVKVYRNELEYIFKNNHEIGNHSYNHPDFKNISFDECYDEFNKTQNIIFEIIKHYPRLFRFPYGSVNSEFLSNLKFPVILWNVDSIDWRKEENDVIVNRVLKEVKEKSIILFHDFKYTNLNVISEIIDVLKKQEYSFVTVSNLMEFNTDDDMILEKVYYCG